MSTNPFKFDTEFSTTVGTSKDYKDLYNMCAIAVETGNFAKAREYLATAEGDFPAAVLHVRHAIAVHYNIAI